MLTIYLIRTGDTEYDGQGRIQGTLDVPLSADGQQQVEDASAELAREQPPIEAIYSGPCSSDVQTAKTIAERLKLKAKKLPGLENLDHGLWQGMLVEEVRSNQPKVYRKWQDSPDTICPPEGEPVSAARERLEKALKKLAKKHKHGVIALVLPNPLAAVLHSQLSHEKLADLWHSDEGAISLWEKIPYTLPVGAEK